MPGYLHYKNMRIHYLKEGEGETTLLFVHGLPLQAQSWQKQIHYFRKQYTTLAIDLPGYGLSSPLPTTPIPQLSRFYSDLISDVLKQLHINKVVYIGFATGGHIGM